MHNIKVTYGITYDDTRLRAIDHKYRGICFECYFPKNKILTVDKQLVKKNVPVILKGFFDNFYNQLSDSENMLAQKIYGKNDIS